MYLIEIDTRKFDFEGVSHEEYLELRHACIRVAL